MTTIYTTKSGDMVDEIAFKHYGSTTGRIVEQVLEANPGLADMDAILPAGIAITMPDAPTIDQVKGVRLWD